MSRTIFLLPFLFLLLLAQGAETSYRNLMSQEEKNEETSERVLIRTKRRWVLTTIELEEESPGPFPIKLTQLFNDKQDSHTIRFSISGHGVTKEPVGALRIDERTGEVWMLKPIDREKCPIFQVEFNVFDANTGELLDKTLAFNVDVKDKNDNAPLFKPQVLNVRIPENTKEGEFPFSLQASDKDAEGSENSRISMEITSQNPSSPNINLRYFGSINDSTVTKLAFTGCFDYDKEKNYRILVVGRDHGKPSLSSTTTVNIGITDSNTHPPVFTAPSFNASVMEMETDKVILRIPVTDQDTPRTPASRAVFTILKGNEEGNYKIETDPVTNEGVLTVIKAKDYEKTTSTELEIGVENEEPLFLCVDGKPVSPIPETLTKNSKIKVGVEIIDVNDPPVFQNTIKTVYRMEEEEPGDVLYIPTVTDEDSDLAKVRYVLLEDPAKWVSLDPKTGKVTTIKKMDRESPHVRNNTYTVVMQAIDDGKPPATGTGTLVVNLGDKNDNAPHLLSNTSVLCGDKSDRVKVMANDIDDYPFSGPFTFTLGKEDKELKSQWKFDPETGPETSLISLTGQPYGTYLVPLKIADQQGVQRHATMQVSVCNCANGEICRDLQPRSTNLHIIAIGILLGSLLLMALLLCCCFLCEFGEKEKDFNGCFLSDGNQTLMTYNDEGGGSLCKDDPLFMTSWMTEQNEFRSSPSNYSGTIRTGTIQPTLGSNGFRGRSDRGTIYGRSTSFTRNSLYDNSLYDAARGGLNRSLSYNIEDFIEMKGYGIEVELAQDDVHQVPLFDWAPLEIKENPVLAMKLSDLSMEQQDYPEYDPRDYSSEGNNVSNVSLDKLSFHSTGDDLDLLQNLGPKFSTLDGICREALKEKNINL